MNRLSEAFNQYLRGRSGNCSYYTIDSRELS
nr:MAG TPA: hypothetical protein [Caudoviricetes sp.]